MCCCNCYALFVNITPQNAPKSIQLLGRCQSLDFGQDFGIVLDYAHTCESLKNFLKVAAPKNKKNIIVLGCPGERDTKKRCLMGRLAAKFCDVVILTADNPASENARRIMWEMSQKICKTKVFFVENRKLAIKTAIMIADKNSNVLLVGKGTEEYQIVGDKKVFHSDFLCCKKVVENLQNKN